VFDTLPIVHFVVLLEHQFPSIKVTAMLAGLLASMAATAPVGESEDASKIAIDKRNPGGIHDVRNYNGDAANRNVLLQLERRY
jgi:hypothetical protein